MFQISLRRELMDTDNKIQEYAFTGNMHDLCLEIRILYNYAISLYNGSPYVQQYLEKEFQEAGLKAGIDLRKVPGSIRPFEYEISFRMVAVVHRPIDAVVPRRGSETVFFQHPHGLSWKK